MKVDLVQMMLVAELRVKNLSLQARVDELETRLVHARLDLALERAGRPVESPSLSDWVAEVEARDGKPALGDPDDALSAYGFPEPLRDERLHPVMAGVLSGHLQAARGR